METGQNGNDLDFFKLDVEKLTGHPTKDSACGVFSGRVSFQDGTIATIVSCILVKGEKAEGAQNLIKDVFDLISRKLEGADSGSLDGLRAVGDTSREFVEKAGVDVSFCHALFYKKAVYIFKHGEDVKVWAYDGLKSKELSFEYGSGPQKEGQFYLIATKKFLDSFDLSSSLAEKEVDTHELVDGLATEISAKSNQSEIAAAIIHIKRSSEEVAEVLGESIDGVKEPDAEVGAQEDKSAGEETEKTVEEEPKQEDSEDLRPVPNEVDVAVSGEQTETADVSDGATVEQIKPRFKNLLPKVLGVIASEVKKLRRGDVGAIFRLRRNIVSVAVVILLFLAVSAFFTIRAGQSRKKLAEFNSHFALASSKFDEANAIITLNRTRAREILVSADGEVKAALRLVPKDEKAYELDSKINGKLKETESLSTVSLSTLVEVDGNLVSLVKSGKNLAGFSGDQIFNVDVGAKSVDKVSGKSATTSGFVYDNKAFVYSGSDVYKVDLASGKAEKAFSGEKAVDMAVFLGNVYLLSDNQIFKHTPFEGGYGEGVNYLNGDMQFDSSSRFAIDGSVWVTKGGEILNFLRGEKKDFAISGLVGAQLKLGPIFTDSDTDNLYVVDTQNSALLVVGRDGIYKKSYQGSDFGKASDLVVDEAGGKMYLAVGNKILVGDL